METGKRVQVYFNLHKKVFSVRCKKTRLVIAHVNNIYLEDVVFKVSENGRQRVLKEQRKNVHAYVEGTVSTNKSTAIQGFITYNPYKYDSFIFKSSEVPVKTLNFTSMHVLNKKPITIGGY